MIRVVKPTDQEIETIKNILLDLAEYYSVRLSDKQIEMYTEDLIEMGSDAVLKSVTEYRKSWDNSTFPLPARLRKQVYFGLGFVNPY